MTRKALILSLQHAITQELIDSHRIEFLINTKNEQVSRSEFLNFIKQNNHETVYEYLKDFSMKKNRARFNHLGLDTMIQAIKTVLFAQLENAAPPLSAELSAQIQQGFPLRATRTASSASESTVVEPNMEADAKTSVANVEKADASIANVAETDMNADAKTTKVKVFDEAKAEEKSHLRIDLDAIHEQEVAEAKSRTASPKKTVTFATKLVTDDVLADAATKEPQVKNLGQNSFFSVPECLIPGFTAKVVISSIAFFGAASFIGLMCVAGPHLALILATAVFALIAAAGIYSLSKDFANTPVTVPSK